MVGAKISRRTSCFGIHTDVHHRTNDTSIKSTWATLQERPIIFRLVQGILSGFALVFYGFAFGRGGSIPALGYAAFTSIFGIAACILTFATRRIERLTVFRLLVVNGVAAILLATGGVAAAVKSFICIDLGCSLGDVMAILLFLACLASVGAAYLLWREHKGEDAVGAAAST
ncbi:hypothetical protein B0A48_10427 [Cryoendolithus antarcticus]|uniref:Uncharacterized protein n=1 Tax=Cryoendolithus antarcticus TaxID=1507870 RepID=A0A1V8SXB0_9PEZI|nr:hypothetical protein B0A48_10427 [Cryoendolithus antarcticus]